MINKILLKFIVFIKFIKVIVFLNILRFIYKIIIIGYY